MPPHKPATYFGMTEATTETEWWRGLTLPPVIETPRLTLRPHAPGDGPALKAAIDANLEHLQRWMDWAVREPSPVDVIEDRIANFVASFAMGRDWGYGIRLVSDPGTIIGGCGMHARIGINALEIGYWLDSRQTGRGYATEAAAALVKAAFSLPGIEHVEIRCAPDNVASAAIPLRLGFVYVTTLEKNAKTPRGEPRDTMVFALTRARYSIHGDSV
jgi:RimJ/RimL family protein N-acetyltransferase